MGWGWLGGLGFGGRPVVLLDGVVFVVLGFVFVFAGGHAVFICIGVCGCFCRWTVFICIGSW